MPDILNKIVTQTREDLAGRKKKIGAADFRSFEDYQRERKSLRDALNAGDDVRIIAEIKKASPSKGLIRDDFNPEWIAECYMNAGAAAISVLTDEPFFKGSLDYLKSVSHIADIPLLRKDFIVDFYQIPEARAYGADAVLLIATILDPVLLGELHQAAEEEGLQCLVECYNEDDLRKINFSQVRIYGVNNRDLKTFSVSLHQGVELLQRAPGDIVKVSESGITSRKDLDYLASHDIHAALIGEYLMSQPHPGEALSGLRGITKSAEKE
ncbi:MAG: indole-3-glycerol phosphate synthase TrpC [Cyclonatronaceae bacterium]